jgi:uncharacterized damage-inducible protein DinB
MAMKDLLLTQTIDAFEGNEEMSLLSSVESLPQKESEWKLNESSWTIEEILYHVASSKIYYCRQGFSKWNEPEEKPFGNIAAMIDLNRRAHSHLLECLRDCIEDDSQKPIPTRCHGKTAANFFWVMIMHDINHGAQIKTIRRAYGSISDYYPIKRE